MDVSHSQLSKPGHRKFWPESELDASLMSVDRLDFCQRNHQRVLTFARWQPWPQTVSRSQRPCRSLALWKVTASCDQDMLTWRWRCHGVCCSARKSFEQRRSLQDYPRCFWGSKCKKVFGYVLISLLTSRSLLANRRKSRTCAWRAFELIFNISNTHQSLRSKRRFPNATPLALPSSSVYSTHCSGSWNSPMNYLLASVLNMQKTQAPWKYFSNREIDRSRHSMTPKHQSFFVSNEVRLWILEYDHQKSYVHIKRTLPHLSLFFFRFYVSFKAKPHLWRIQGLKIRAIQLVVTRNRSGSWSCFKPSSCQSRSWIERPPLVHLSWQSGLANRSPLAAKKKWAFSCHASRLPHTKEGCAKEVHCLGFLLKVMDVSHSQLESELDVGWQTWFLPEKSSACSHFCTMTAMADMLLWCEGWDFLRFYLVANEDIIWGRHVQRDSNCTVI